MKNKKYYWSLDLIKILTIIPGLAFHANEFLSVGDELIQGNLVTLFIKVFSKILFFSGFLATFIGFFCLGMAKNAIPTKKHWIFISLGTLLTHFLYYDNSSPFFQTEWTYFHFLWVVFVIIYALEKSLNGILKFETIALWLSLILLVSINLKQLHNWIAHKTSLNPILAIPTITGCSFSLYGEWPILPWIFLPIFSFYLGRVSLKRWFHTNKNWFDYILIGVSFSSMVYAWPKLFVGPTDIYFSCFLFYHSPSWFIVFTLIPFITLIRWNALSHQQNINFRSKKFIIFNPWLKYYSGSYLLSLIVIGSYSIAFKALEIHYNSQIFLAVLIGSLILGFLAPQLLRLLKFY